MVNLAVSRGVGTELQFRPTDLPSRKPRPRLREFDYIGRYAYHIVSSTSHRKAYFKDFELVASAAQRLQDVAERLNFRVLAYCFMPDHFHTLALGDGESANLIRFVQRFKQETGYHFKKATGEHLWQQSFFDHASRTEENLDAVAGYIFENPVRSGLVSSPGLYLGLGGEYWANYAATDGTEVPSLRPQATKK